MCGIAGYLSTQSASEAPALDVTRRMVNHMRPRGPDAEGLWTGEGVVLGHRRLAILDLDARANQPMAQWLSDATDRSAWENVPLLSKPGTPWARRWAKVVVERTFECE